jgi:hypothetical protein
MTPVRVSTPDFVRPLAQYAVATRRIVSCARMAGALPAGEGWKLNRTAQPSVATKLRIITLSGFRSVPDDQTACRQ